MSFLNNATNETLETDFALEEDFFAGVYNDKVAVASMVIMYIIGLVGVIGILFIIWIERSGQAGPYRKYSKSTGNSQLSSGKFNDVDNAVWTFQKCTL